MKKILLSLWMVLAAGPFAFALTPYGHLDFGAAFGSENTNLAPEWEIRLGVLRPVFGPLYADHSVGFRNFASDSVKTAPDRLVQGDLAMRTFMTQHGVVLAVTDKARLSFSAGPGWTWVQHSAGGVVTLADLRPYEADAHLTSVAERIHDGMSVIVKWGGQYTVNSQLSLGMTLSYFFMHTFRERDVVIYEEDYSKAYNDRYVTYHWTEPVSLDHWSLMFSAFF